MPYLLLPGRHLVNTTFQETYLRSVMNRPLAELKFLHAPPVKLTQPLETIVFVITSSNQQNSRYNPIEFHIRAIGVDRFAQRLGVKYRIIGVPHYGPTNRFARNTLKEIEEQTEGELEITPENAVFCGSTPAVIGMYRELGFGVLGAELKVSDEATERRSDEGEERQRQNVQLSTSNVQRPSEEDAAFFAVPTPIDLVRRAAEAGAKWVDDAFLAEHLHPATRSLWLDFPQVPARITRLYRDPLLNDQGSLTDTRNYAVYTWAMSNPAAIELKYKDIADAIVPGKIVDEGCADAGLLVPIARDFGDSDLIGIEITGEFIAQCRERQRRGDFGQTYVHFHQRNLMDDIFEPGSIDTTICNSTVHELWSYGEQAKTVRAYLRRKFAQTRRGGRIIVRDVLSPEDAEQEVWLWCESGTGVSPVNSSEDYCKYLDSLSTAERFKLFARDFLAKLREKGARAADTAVRYREEVRDGKMYFVTSLKWATEFLTKKDYTDSWNSEMNEEFTYWSFGEWKRELAEAGFHVMARSRAYANPWIIANRFDGKVALFRPEAIEKMDWPVTNLVIVGERA
jgi:hypothetical protein